MQKKYTSLGLMSGTSGDGVDASIIISNGIDQYEVIKDKFFEYDSILFKEYHSLKEKIFISLDLKKLSKEISNLERKITLFHAKIINELVKKRDENILIGFHGQTIYHNSKEKISRQIGDAKLLNQLTKKKIVFNFRKNDLLNGGEGAPLVPIFHQLISSQNKIDLPVCFLNIGGISNATIVKQFSNPKEIFSKDIGPGNCLIDEWVRKNSVRKFDNEGKLAALGKKNEIIFEQAQDLYSNRIDKDKASFDINDFDISFSRGLSLEDGAMTLTEFTASIIGESLLTLIKDQKDLKEILICGGGRKNKILIKAINKIIPENINLKLIDEYGVKGDFVESQAFAYIAIRTYKNLPTSFPSTTSCKTPTVGGEIIEN